MHQFFIYLINYSKTKKLQITFLQITVHLNFILKKIIERKMNIQLYLDRNSLKPADARNKTCGGKNYCIFDKL